MRYEFSEYHVANVHASLAFSNESKIRTILNLSMFVRRRDFRFSFGSLIYLSLPLTLWLRIVVIMIIIVIRIGIEWNETPGKVKDTFSLPFDALTSNALRCFEMEMFLPRFSVCAAHTVHSHFIGANRFSFPSSPPTCSVVMMIVWTRSSDHSTHSNELSSQRNFHWRCQRAKASPFSSSSSTQGPRPRISSIEWNEKHQPKQQQCQQATKSRRLRRLRHHIFLFVCRCPSKLCQKMFASH